MATIRGPLGVFTEIIKGVGTGAKQTIQNGSQGEDVSTWQQFLKNVGYNIDVDGIFGPLTAAATKAWQTGKGLVSDGIVGAKSWAEAYKNNTAETADKNNTAGTADGWKYDDFSYDDFSYKDYVESDTVKNAGAALNSHLANKPAEYQSQWQAQLDNVMNRIMNREKFSYDFNEDALYQQYKDKYIQQGKLAMADTMGQAAAMTGGYGNSYAQSVGQQAYQAQLNNLNDIIPELYQMALDKYNQEGQDLYNQYGILSDRENLDYNRYRDTVSDYLTERDYLTGRYDSERDYDYSKYTNERGFAYDKYSSDRNLAYDEYATDKNLSYQEHRDAIADEQWQKEYDEDVRQFNVDQTFKEKKYNASINSSGGSVGGSGSSGGSGGGSGSGNINDDVETKDTYADWGHGEWGGYFATIRNTEGVAAAEEEFDRMVDAGLIPENMIAAAAYGVRGSLID